MSNHNKRVPTTVEMLAMIVDISQRGGNATINQIRDRARPSKEQVQSKAGPH